MHKIIPVDELEVGMYISDVHNDWIPASRKKRKGYIRSEATINKIISLGVLKVCIETVPDDYESETGQTTALKPAKTNNPVPKPKAAKSKGNNNPSTNQSKETTKSPSDQKKTSTANKVAIGGESEQPASSELDQPNSTTPSSKKEQIKPSTNTSDQTETDDSIIEPNKGLLDEIAEAKTNEPESTASTGQSSKGLLDELAEARKNEPESTASTGQSSKGLLDELAEAKKDEAESSDSAGQSSKGLLDEIAEAKKDEAESSDSAGQSSKGLLDEIAEAKKEESASEPKKAIGLVDQYQKDNAERLNASPKQAPSIKEGIAQKAKRHLPGAITVPFEEEIENAKNLHGKVKERVQYSMSQAKIGKPVDIEGIESLADGLIESIISNRNTLSMMTVLKKQDNYLHEHSVNSSILMGIFARQMKLPFDKIHDLVVGAMLQDIGMSQIPIELINKAGKLSTEERKEVERHVILGRKMLEKTHGVPAIVLEICKQHHEHLDGQGYPQRMHSHQINQFARMSSIVDVYDALTSVRAYRKAYSPSAAMKKLLALNGKQLDAKLVYQFIQSINIYPVGSLVELDDSRVGVVREINVFKKDKPKVSVFFNGKSNVNIPINTIDLSHPDVKAKIKATANIDDFDIELEDVI